MAHFVCSDLRERTLAKIMKEAEFGLFEKKVALTNPEGRHGRAGPINAVIKEYKELKAMWTQQDEKLRAWEQKQAQHRSAVSEVRKELSSRRKQHEQTSASRLQELVAELRHAVEATKHKYRQQENKRRQHHQKMAEMLVAFA